MLTGQESYFWVTLFTALSPSPQVFVNFPGWGVYLGPKQQRCPIDLDRLLQAYASLKNLQIFTVYELTNANRLIPI